MSPSRFSRSCHPLGHVARRELPAGPPPPHRPSPGCGFASSRRGFHRTEARSIRLRPMAGIHRDAVSIETHTTISASSPSWPNSQALPCTLRRGGVSGLSSLSYSRSGLFITGCPKGVDPPAWPVSRLTAPDASQVARGGCTAAPCPLDGILTRFHCDGLSLSRGLSSSPWIGGVRHRVEHEDWQRWVVLTHEPPSSRTSTSRCIRLYLDTLSR